MDQRTAQTHCCYVSADELIKLIKTRHCNDGYWLIDSNRIQLSVACKGPAHIWLNQPAVSEQQAMAIEEEVDFRAVAWERYPEFTLCHLAGAWEPYWDQMVSESLPEQKSNLFKKKNSKNTVEVKTDLYSTGVIATWKHWK